MRVKKPLPIGVDLYKEIIDEGYYYVDKTLLIRDLLDQRGAGGFIEKIAHEEVTYGGIYRLPDNLWNFLFFTGYLKVAGRCLEGCSTFLLTLY